MMGMELLYQEVLQKQKAYEAAEAGWQKAQEDKKAADLQYSLGMLSRENYLSARRLAGWRGGWTAGRLGSDGGHGKL